MRFAAISSAASASLLHRLSAASISAWFRRNVCAVNAALSNLLVSSTSAASPRSRTSATMARTEAATSSSVSRLAEINALNCAAKSGARASRRRAMSGIRFVFGTAERGPFAADIAEARIDGFDVKLDRAAAGENQFHHAARIFRALRRERDGKERQHRIGIAAHDLVGLGGQDTIEIEPAADTQI